MPVRLQAVFTGISHMERKRKMANQWQRIEHMPSTGLYDPMQRVTASDSHIALALEAAEEGQVLLKNEGILPFPRGQKLAVFGKAQADYVRGGGGSGVVYTPYSRSLLEGLEIEEKDGCVTLFPDTGFFYRDYVARQYGSGKQPGQLTEPEVPQTLLKDAAVFTDTAIITICRFSGEGWDRTGNAYDGDFYLSHEEEAMVEAVRMHFPKVCVVLNVGGMMDTAWLHGVQAALLAWQGGTEGGWATARLLTGKATPSGHLTDTFAVNFDAYPSSASFWESEDYVEYTDDVYVGYRYFETIPGAKEKVVYPFGYGLSYTSFTMQAGNVTCLEDRFSVPVRVCNTGKHAGKQVVQVYAGLPRGRLQKPSVVLVGFAKTRLLLPGEEECVTIQWGVRDFASFDDTGVICSHAWVLEEGAYSFFAGANARELDIRAGTWTLSEDRVLEKLVSRMAPQNLTQRLQSDGTMQPVPHAEKAVRPMDDMNGLPMDGRVPDDRTWIDETARWQPSSACKLSAVAEGQYALDTLLDTLTLEQKIHLLGGQPNRGCANTYGFGNIPKYHIPNVMTCDGPAGVRIKPECGVTTTAFPCATLLACSWNLSILERVGTAAAEEAAENGFGVWLAPAMNIHRTPLCGRNFEYYSEDPLVTGLCAAAMVRGIQKMGIAATIKHFACNNKETNRRESDSRVSERALREIYLRGFEICVRTADPWALMTSYNIINGERASCNKDLITHILREEWGYRGVVTTDWYTHGEQWREILAGNDIKMGCGTPKETLQAVYDGRLSEADVSACARRVLEMILKLR